MPTTKKAAWLAEEIADFLATCPTREQFLGYSPSEQARQRLHVLLEKNRQGGLSEEERRELDQFEYAEMLLRLVKVRLRLNRRLQK